MVKRTQGLPINTVVLAIIALLVIIFLVLIFTGGIGRFASGIRNTGASHTEISAGQCSEYASILQSSLISTSSSSIQLSLIESSQYVTSNCSFVYPYTFPLSNGSEVVCDGNTNTNGEIDITVNGKSVPSGCYLT